MCCFFTALVFFGPRLGFLIYWLIAPIRVGAAFQAFNLPWLVGIASLIFAPWTALMYVMIFPLNGFDWIWLGLGILADVATDVPILLGDTTNPVTSLVPVEVAADEDWGAVVVAAHCLSAETHGDDGVSDLRGWVAVAPKTAFY